MAGRAASVALAAVLAACCAPAWAIAAEQAQGGSEQAAAQEASDTFDSAVGLSDTRWIDVPSIAGAWKNLHGSGGTASSLASFRNLFLAAYEHGSRLLGDYEGGAPVLLENGHHYRMGAQALAAAESALVEAKAEARADTTTAYYDQSRAVIGAVNAALISVEAAPDADALKLIWDGRALDQVADEAAKGVILSKGRSATSRAISLSLEAPLSQSGAAASFSKAGGSSRITVTKSGKCTLKKGTKKGTHTARIRVVYSDNTAKTAAVSFIVK